MENSVPGKIALITGITGQDGSYLAELLLSKGYSVHGITRNLSAGKEKFWRIARIMDKISLREGDISDQDMIHKLVADILPDEIYHFAGQKQSQDFEKDFATFPLNIDVTRNFLAAIKEIKPSCRFFFAGSSEMFGHPKISPQNEETPFAPVSPYAISKVAGYFITKAYREIGGIFTCTGILFNHESSRRDPMYLSRKVSLAVARIKAGTQNELKLGDLESRRDWGSAKDFVEGMWLMLQQDEPDDYVLGTGETHSVKDLVEAAFGSAGLEWDKYVKVDESLKRAKDLDLRADIAKVKNKLGWKPKHSFDELVREMVLADIKTS